MQVNSIQKTVSATKLIGVVVLVLLLGSGCGDDSAETVGADDGFEPAFDCEGLADRWVVINQAYLDDLGELALADLEPPGPVADAAARRLAMSLTEQIRDAVAVGCAARLTSGSEPLCSRIDRLSASGPAGESIIRQLRDGCPPDAGG